MDGVEDVGTSNHGCYPRWRPGQVACIALEEGVNDVVWVPFPVVVLVPGGMVGLLNFLKADCDGAIGPSESG